MSAATIHALPQRRSRVAHFRLDVAEWTVLHAAVSVHAARTASPGAFDPATFGLDPDLLLSVAERERAWAGLQLRGLATHVPATDDVAALTPSCVLGMLMLLESEVRVDVSSWSGDTVVNQSIAWSGGRTAALARRRRQAGTGEGTAGMEQDPVVDFSMSSAGGLLAEVMQTLPGDIPSRPGGDRSPVRLGLPESAAIARALRSEGDEVAAQLAGLPASALSVLGSASAPVTGGACISALRAPHDPAPGFHGVWLWTADDVIELVDATPAAVTLRRTDLPRVRSGLLTALTGLLHAEEVL